MSLQISREGRVLRIALNRPAKRNALKSGMCHELVEAISDAETDRSIGAILLEGAGDVFCAGMDLDEVLLPGAAEQTKIHEDLFSLGARLVKPIVAAVQGAALGGGIGLIANAHVVVAAHGTSFGLTEIRTGMWPFVVFRSVSVAIGERRALELSLTGRIFGTTEALQYGLVQHVTPAIELDDRASAIAGGLANSSPETIRRGMSMVRESRELNWKDACELALSARARAFASPDFAEGVRAFKEKRQPRWPSLEER